MAPSPVELVTSRRGEVRLLYLHGYGAVAGGFKSRWLAEQGFQVTCPQLPDDDFSAALALAADALQACQPRCVVGSSRGAAVAMHLLLGNTPRVLLAPAWKRWGTACTIAPPVAILHAAGDTVIPLADSQELLAASGLPESLLQVVGDAHPLTDPAALSALLETIERLTLGE